MSSPGVTAPSTEQTIARARAVRAEHALAAARYANRVEQARAASRYTAMARWTAEYRNSAARCRRLGEIIRGEREAARPRPPGEIIRGEREAARPRPPGEIIRGEREAA